jgi:predicted MFS family arabinose efflux permease
MDANEVVVVAGVIFIIGGTLQTACNGKEMMLAGRFIAGMGIGFLGVLAPRKHILHTPGTQSLTISLPI